MDIVIYEVKDRVAIITLNRAEKRNALNRGLVSKLKSSLARAEADQLVKVIVLKATGDTFCSGADLQSLQEMQQFSYEENLEDSMHLKDLFLQIYTLRKVVIAQVQGHALAGGCGLATVCDFVFAAPHVKMGYTEVKIGFVPALVMVFLIRKIGEQKARRLLLSGDLISGDEAVSMELVTQLVEKEKLQEYVMDFAAKLIENNSAQSMERTKQMLSQVQSMTLHQSLEYAATMNAEARGTTDCIKGVTAFLNKSTLRW